MVGREVKSAALYDAQDCAKESEQHAVAMLLWVEMLRQRFDQAKLLVVLSDGAEWIRSLADWLPIPVLLILDLFHVKHRIWEVANSPYGEHSPKARLWAELQAERIEAGL